MATTKKSRSATQRKTAATQSDAQTNGRSSRATSSPKRTTKTANRSTARSGAASPKRRTTSAKRTTSPRASGTSNAASRNGASSSDGLATSLKSMGGTVVHGMDRAAKPALAVGATAVGIAGGIALRRRHKSTLPFGLPRNGDGIDVIAISKAVGKASARFGQTAKSVSKDIDTAADRAERIGKILS